MFFEYLTEAPNLEASLSANALSSVNEPYYEKTKAPAPFLFPFDC